MHMPWQAAIGLAILANVVTILIQRRYSLKSNVPETFPTAISYLLGVMPIGVTVGLYLPHRVTWSWQLARLLFICATSMAVSCWIGFKAVKLLPVAPYQTISRFTAIVAIALGWAVLGEGLSRYQVLGAFLLLLGALLAIWAPIKRPDITQRVIHIRAVLLTLLASTLLAITLVSEKAILGHIQVGGVLILGWGSQTLAMLLLALKDAGRVNLRKFNYYELRWSAVMGLANGVTGAFYVYSLNKSNNISLITALTAIALPLTVFGAHLFLKERENSKLMWLSLAVCFIGLLVSAT